MQAMGRAERPLEMIRRQLDRTIKHSRIPEEPLPRGNEYRYVRYEQITPILPSVMLVCASNVLYQILPSGRFVSVLCYLEFH